MLFYKIANLRKCLLLSAAATVLILGYAGASLAGGSTSDRSIHYNPFAPLKQNDASQSVSVSPDIETNVGPNMAVAIPAWSDRNTELTFSNSSDQEICLAVSSAGFNGQVCVPGLGNILLTKLFRGTVSIQNKSTVASIRIRGRWL